MSGSANMTASPLPKVLVVEDNRDFAQLLSDILVIKGCETDIAYDVPSALEKVKGVSFDLVFSDINISGAYGGLKLARAIRQDSRLSALPIIAVSGYTGAEERQQAIDAGFDLIFPKPVKFADLSMALERYSKGR